MITWILLALLIYYIGLFLPSLFLIPRIGLGPYLATRDDDPEPSVVAGRVKRSHANFCENLAPFLALAILTMIVPGTNTAIAILGAQLFVFARLVYLPLYAVAVPLVRSVAFTVGFIGLAMMAYALI